MRLYYAPGVQVAGSFEVVAGWMAVTTGDGVLFWYCFSAHLERSDSHRSTSWEATKMKREIQKG